MTNYKYIISMVLLIFTCSTTANIKPKEQKNVTRSGQKRIDVQVSKWKEAQSAINSLIDQSISNEVVKAKKEVKALLEKNIAKHLHEASKKVMEGNLQLDGNGINSEDDETEEESNDGVCQDEFDNCASLAQSGVCETSKEAMKKHCARTCELCDDNDDLPPATQSSTSGNEGDNWTIIGADGKKLMPSGIQRGTRKASITTAQVERLLEYVKAHAHHLKLKKIKPGVLKLIRISDEEKDEEKDEQKDKQKPKIESKTPSKEESKQVTKIQHDSTDHDNDDNYWHVKDKEEQKNVEPKKTAKGPMLHFDLTSIMKNNGELDDEFKAPTIHKSEKPHSGEYLKHICHPMCKKTCISSCAPGCCAGEHQHEFPLYHRKSSHCHPFCKKHCISSCPLTCCAETTRTSKSWHHPVVHRFTPGCHPMCKKHCVPSCPKACCAQEVTKPKSHCHPLCKKSCLSSCPLSCCSHKDRLKETCHPLCRKTCLPSCPDECCTKGAKEQKLIVKESSNTKEDEEKEETTHKTCPAPCRDSCAPACHAACCNPGPEERNKAISHLVPSGCTANCVYECLPGCPPACCAKSLLPTSTVASHTEDHSNSISSPIVLPYTQPLVTTFTVPPPPPRPPAAPVYQVQHPATYITPTFEGFMEPAPRVPESTSLFAPKHCSSACLTHCSPECARSDCCDLDD